jgi:molybdenum cofactor cytidylyltransferase
LNKTKIPIVILAAGQSKRLGRPKQLVHYQGDTLLNNTIKIAFEVSQNVIVVLGANHEIISKELLPIPELTILTNDIWVTGMASSIKLAVEFLKKQEAILFILCDQPFLNAKILLKMIKEYKKTNLAIVACEYAGQLGVPILFNSQLFNELQLLSGESGAKSIIKNYKSSIAKVAFSKGEIDIDTETDLKRLESSI